MPCRPRKSSRQITLVLLGAATLASCSPDQPGRRAYATKEACLADWGDPQDCEEQFAAQTDGTRRGYYGRGGGWGGWWGGGGTAGGGARSGGGAPAGGTVRGGFGASGHAHGSGGHG